MPSGGATAWDAQGGAHKGELRSTRGVRSRRCVRSHPPGEALGLWGPWLLWACPRGSCSVTQEASMSLDKWFCCVWVLAYVLPAPQLSLALGLGFVVKKELPLGPRWPGLSLGAPALTLGPMPPRACGHRLHVQGQWLLPGLPCCHALGWGTQPPPWQGGRGCFLSPLPDDGSVRPVAQPCWRSCTS